MTTPTLNILPAPPYNAIGPGVRLTVNTNIQGPLPTGSTWEIDVYETPPGEAQGYTWSYNALGMAQQMILGEQTELAAFGQGQFAPKQGDQVLLKVALQEPTGTLISNQMTVTWEGQTGLGMLLQQQAQGQGQGLTDAQAQQLTTIETNTNTMVPTTNIIPTIQTTTDSIQTDTTNIVNTLFPQLSNFLNAMNQNVLSGLQTTITTAAGDVVGWISDFFRSHAADVFGLDNITGGPTCDRVDYVIGGNSNVWGVFVHITTRPTHFHPLTPDEDWCAQDMAVLQIIRSGFPLLRRPIHTTWEIIQPIPETLPIGLANIAVPIIPSDYHIVVDWAAGVCGEVLIQYLP